MKEPDSVADVTKRVIDGLSVFVDPENANLGYEFRHGFLDPETVLIIARLFEATAIDPSEFESLCGDRAQVSAAIKAVLSDLSKTFALLYVYPYRGEPQREVFVVHGLLASEIWPIYKAVSLRLSGPETVKEPTP